MTAEERAEGLFATCLHFRKGGWVCSPCIASAIRDAEREAAKRTAEEFVAAGVDSRERRALRMIAGHLKPGSLAALRDEESAP